MMRKQLGPLLIWKSVRVFAIFRRYVCIDIDGGLLGEKYIGLMTGGDPNNLVDGDVIYDTQSAVILEELIGKFLLNMSGK